MTNSRRFRVSWAPFQDLWSKAREVEVLNAKVDDLEDLLEKVTQKEAQNDALTREAEKVMVIKAKVSSGDVLPWW